jgi:hypothetical protein
MMEAVTTNGSCAIRKLGIQRNSVQHPCSFGSDVIVVNSAVACPMHSELPSPSEARPPFRLVLLRLG